MRVYTPKEVNPRFSNNTAVFYPQLASSSEYDAGARAEFLTNQLGIPSFVVDRPIPRPRIIDLAGRNRTPEENYMLQMQHAVKDAFRTVSDDLDERTSFIHAGNSAGGLGALIGGLHMSDRLPRTSGIIAFDPSAQVKHSKTVSMARFIAQAAVERSKPSELTVQESLGMEPFRTPTSKLIPRQFHELFGHQDVWNTDLAKHLILEALGKSALKLYVALPGRSPMASRQEQALMLAEFEPLVISQNNKYVFRDDSAFHSSYDKPGPYVKAFETICLARRPYN